MIPVYRPYLTDRNTQDAIKAIESKWISSSGEYIDKAKNLIKKVQPNKYTILCNNGTAATHLLSIGLKFKFPEIDKLLVPDNVYVAAWNSFITYPNYDLIPVRSNIETFNYDLEALDSQLLKNNPKNTAVLIVHNVGNIINVPSLKEKYPDYIFVEDNCEGFTGEYSGMLSGAASLMSSVSFFGNKTITCGEGGAVFTDDEEIFEYLNSVRCQGITHKKFVFDKIGYNYRMTNIQAALLAGQLEDLETIKTLKKEVFNKYHNLLSDVCIFPKEEAGTKSANWMVTVRFPDRAATDISFELFQNSVETRPMFPPITHHKHLKQYQISENEAAPSEKLYKETLMLPSYPELTNSEINYICDKIKGIL